MWSVKGNTGTSHPSSEKKIVVRPSGLSEALWACVLDDYLSEEEEGEIKKVIGNGEKTPWYLSPDTVACAGQRPTGQHQFQDPRDAKERGGRACDSSDEGRDGTPGVWDDISSTPEMPPVMWLSVPPTDDEGNVLDWNGDTPEWDGSDHYNRIEDANRGAKRGKRDSNEEIFTYHETTQLAKARSRQSSKANSRSTARSASRLSARYPTTLSNTSSEMMMSRLTPRAVSKSSRSRSRSKSRTRYSRKAPNDEMESRQSNQSPKRESYARRQSMGEQSKSRTRNLQRDARMTATNRASVPISRSTSIKEQHSFKRVPSQGLRARLRDALAG